MKDAAGAATAATLRGTPLCERSPLLPAQGVGGSDGCFRAVFRVAWCGAVAAGFIAASSIMIIFNKWLMHPERFPFPAPLASLHMLGSFVLASGLRCVSPGLFPSSHMLVAGDCGKAADEESAISVAPCWPSFRPNMFLTLAPFLPMGVCFASSLVTGNWAYRYSTVTFLQTIKEGQIGLTYAMSVLFGLERVHARSVLIIGFIAVSAMFAVHRQTEPSFAAFGLQMMAGTSTALQVVLMNRLMVRGGGGRVDPMTMVLRMAPATFLVLVPVNLSLWDCRIPVRLANHALPVLGNVVLAFILQVVSSVTISTLSAVGLCIASSVKDVMVVFIATHALHDPVTTLQMVGFMGSVVGVVAYTLMKLFADVHDNSKPHAQG